MTLLPLVFGITKYNQCRVGGTRPSEIFIDGCDEAPCPIHEGKSVNAYAVATGGM